MTLQEHLSNKTAPKRMLALDGGGIRGALSLGYLQRIENILRKQNGNNKNFRLSDYFDLIGGTSTGSIIASCLAIGMSVEEIKNMYMDLGAQIFAKKYKWWKIFQIDDLLKAAYNEKPLEEQLQKVFGNIMLGDQVRIKTGLCIVTKRADTNSVWPLINHPDGRYYNSDVGINKDIPLWKAVRASSAAPSYFLPQLIDVGGGLSQAAFVDGGVSMHNNASMQLLMVATLQGFPFKWKWGANNLLLVSVGTGMSRWKEIPDNVKKNNILKWAQQLPDMFMQDASWNNQMLLQWFSNSPTAWEIDSEIGKLENDYIGNVKKDGGLLTYLRYNTWLDADTLNTLMNKTYTQKDIDGLVEMSNADSRFELYDIGSKCAAKEVKNEHFIDAFKL